MCTLSLEIIFTVSFSYHFTVWPHLIHYLSYHLCRMDVMSGRRCQSIGIINGDWIHTAHSIRFDSIFPSSNAALHGTVQRGRAGAEYSRSSVRDSHLHVFKVYIKKIQLVRWRETWFAPNRRIECERHWRNTAKRKKKKKWIAPTPTVFFFFHSLTCAAGVWLFFFCSRFFVSKYWFDQNKPNRMRHNQNAIPIVKSINNGSHADSDSLPIQISTLFSCETFHFFAQLTSLLLALLMF